MSSLHPSIRRLGATSHRPSAIAWIVLQQLATVVALLLLLGTASAFAGSTSPDKDRSVHRATKVLSANQSVIEFFNASLNHYFITSDTREIQLLDTGSLKGWARTGESWRIYGTSEPKPADAKPVCRFYGRPEAGLNSHFYSASPDECSAVLARFSAAWIMESSSVFHTLVPEMVTGACPKGSTPVYRVYNNRSDVNHRYTTSLAIKAEMVGKGWIPEGYGADGIAMCAGEALSELTANAQIQVRMLSEMERASIVSLTADELVADNTLRFSIGDVFAVDGQAYRVTAIIASQSNERRYELDRPSLGDVLAFLRLTGTVVLTPEQFVVDPQFQDKADGAVLPKASLACDDDGCGVRISLDNKVPQANLKGEVTIYMPTISPDIQFDNFAMSSVRLDVKGKLKAEVEASSSVRIETPPMRVGHWVFVTPLTAVSGIVVDIPVYFKLVAEPGVSLKASATLNLDQSFSARADATGTVLARSSNTNVSASADPYPLGAFTLGTELSVGFNLDIQASFLGLAITGNANYIDLIGEVSGKATALGVCGVFTPKVRVVSSMFIAKPKYWINLNRDERLEEAIFELERSIGPDRYLNTACSIDVNDATESAATCLTVVDGAEKTPTLYLNWKPLAGAVKYTTYLDGFQNVAVLSGDVDTLPIPHLKAGRTYFVEVKATRSDGRIQTVLAKSMRIPSGVCDMDRFSIGKYVSTPCWGSQPRMAMSVLGEHDATYIVYRDGQYWTRSGQNECSVRNSGAFITDIIQPGTSRTYHVEILRKDGRVERTDAFRVTMPADACRF